MVNSAPHVGLMKITTTMSNMGKTDNFIDFITISGTIIFERKGSGHSGNSLNKIFAGMTKRGYWKDLCRNRQTEVSFSYASMIWIRFQGTFSGGSFIGNPHP
jgi:hypothetical protein